jgi:hypothetical protein
VRVQCGGSSRSAARSSRRSNQDLVEVAQLQEELRRHQDYLRQYAAQHEYYATQIQQQQTLIQVSSKDNSFRFKICIDLKR